MEAGPRDTAAGAGQSTVAGGVHDTAQDQQDPDGDRLSPDGPNDADGGVTALGPNIFNMALVGTAVAYLLIVVLLRVLPRTPAGLGVTAFLASVVAVVMASLSFVLQYALGGTTDLITSSVGYITAVMAGSHVLIGIGEGIIAALTVMTVAKTRPDLVYALRRMPARPVLAGGAR